MYKIGVIGDRDSVLGFKAAGLGVFPVENENNAGTALNHMLKEEEFAIIYITEQYADLLNETIEQYVDASLPAIIPIPSKDGTLGIGVSNVRRSVERAVGADILFGG